MKHSGSFKTLFRIDGIGAIATAVLLSQVLARFENVFGMPKQVLYPLATVAAAFAAYSFTCAALAKKNLPTFLLIIAIANLSYTLVTLFLVFKYYDQLTILGIAYFAGEILIVVGLSIYEINFVRKYHK